MSFTYRQRNQVWSSGRFSAGAAWYGRIRSQSRSP